MRALEMHGILPQLSKFAGSSAGAIGCTMLALGCTANEVNTLNMAADYTRFIDDSWGFVRDSGRFIQSYGQCPGAYFQNWIEGIIAAKSGVDQLTFGGLYRLTQNKLYITSVNITKDRLVVFSHETHPEMPVSLAVRASMAIPGLFTPVVIDDQLYVDGGLSCNYPLDMFDGDAPAQTLGLKLMGDGEERGDQIYSGPLPTGNVVEYFGSIITHMCNSIERLRIDEKYWPRTIRVPTGTIGTTEFDLSPDRKRAAIDAAHSAANEQIAYFLEHREFPSAPI